MGLNEIISEAIRNDLLVLSLLRSWIPLANTGGNARVMGGYAVQGSMEQVFRGQRPPGSLWESCVALSKLLNLSEPQILFP